MFYYEFEMKQVDGGLTFLSIKDISELIKDHQAACDRNYREAIENNFTHEQMTPLNPILGHSELTKQKIISLYAER